MIQLQELKNIHEIILFYRSIDIFSLLINIKYYLPNKINEVNQRKIFLSRAHFPARFSRPLAVASGGCFRCVFVTFTNAVFSRKSFRLVISPFKKIIEFCLRFISFEFFVMWKCCFWVGKMSDLEKEENIEGKFFIFIVDCYIDMIYVTWYDSLRILLIKDSDFYYKDIKYDYVGK